MAQVIQPEEWVEGLDDNRLLPGRYTTGLFTGNIKGSNKSIANNPAACRVWDIQIPDYITDYDDRRLNGLGGPGKNTHGADGWNASAYGVFQDVRFDSRVYTMGRHRSVAIRIFDEMQYSGDIGEWGTATASNVTTNGQALMKTAAILSKARDLWEQEVLGPDIDKYNLFAVINGHISGRWVQTNPDVIFEDDGQWIAQPGTVEGQAIPPRFAPIHAIEWDDDNIPLMLQTLKVTWNNLFIPQENRVILIDPFYEYRLLAALTGKGIPATEAAYADLQNGSFTRLMGWDFQFDIPSQYWPRIYVDDNLNVVHSADGSAAYDQVIRSVSHAADGPDKQLMLELVDSDRMNRPNYFRTDWDPVTGRFIKTINNYPLGMPAATDYLGEKIQVATGYDAVHKEMYADEAYAQPSDYPWFGPGSGYGLPEEYQTGPVGTIVRRQVIGLALYKPAAQLSQEYSEMRTAEGETRGKFTEMVFDVKYDAWVIESLSHGILPIIDAKENTGTYAIPVQPVAPIEVKPSEGATFGVQGSVDAQVTPAEGATFNTQSTVTPADGAKFEVEGTVDTRQAQVYGISVSDATASIAQNDTFKPTVTVTGYGDFDEGFTATSANEAVATVAADGTITAVADTGTVVITYASVMDPTKTATCTVTATPNL